MPKDPYVTRPCDQVKVPVQELEVFSEIKDDFGPQATYFCKRCQTDHTSLIRN